MEDARGDTGDVRTLIDYFQSDIQIYEAIVLHGIDYNIFRVNYSPSCLKFYRLANIDDTYPRAECTRLCRIVATATYNFGRRKHCEFTRSS